MGRLTKDRLHGIWAALGMCWDERDRFDEAAYQAGIERTLAAGVHGVYTTGSTGEFYAIDFDEFRRMVDLQTALCGAAGMPLQIGCCADATRKTIRLLEYVAARPEVGAAQVCLPYWMELTDREVVTFFGEIHAACPDLPLVHYNLDRAKRFLHAADYRRILDVAPTLIGVKYTGAGTRFTQLRHDIAATPELAFLVGEDVLASAMQHGATGSCSSVVFTNPSIVLELYARAAAREWDRALELEARVGEFIAGLIELVRSRGEGFADPVVDKGMAVASGFSRGHQRCRRPYIGWSDETTSAVRKWMGSDFPEFLCPG